MTAYQRDFTIGLRETMDFYTFLTMRHCAFLIFHVFQ